MKPIDKLMNRFNVRLLALVALLASSLLPAVTFAAPPGDFRVESPADGKTFKLSYEQFVAKLAELKNKPAAIQHYNLGADTVAISGYDPVAYFTLGKALKGRKEISASHRDVTYYFASAEDRKVFAESPDKFIPTYGGWCATAMAKGEKVEIDPINFKVTNGRLFLFFKAFYANAIKDWNKDEPNQTTKADANWMKIAGE